MTGQMSTAGANLTAETVKALSTEQGHHRQRDPAVTSEKHTGQLTRMHTPPKRPTRNRQ